MCLMTYGAAFFTHFFHLNTTPFCDIPIYLNTPLPASKITVYMPSILIDLWLCLRSGGIAFKHI